MTTDTVPQPEIMQSVIITFSDGVVAQFLGKAVTYPGDTRSITSVRFTPPEPLPEDMEFIPIKTQ
jgi:hypothetical protein